MDIPWYTPNFETHPWIHGLGTNWDNLGLKLRCKYLLNCRGFLHITLQFLNFQRTKQMIWNYHIRIHININHEGQLPGELNLPRKCGRIVNLSTSEVTRVARSDGQWQNTEDAFKPITTCLAGWQLTTRVYVYT